MRGEQIRRESQREGGSMTKALQPAIAASHPPTQPCLALDVLVLLQWVWRKQAGRGGAPHNGTLSEPTSAAASPGAFLPLAAGGQRSRRLPCRSC